MKNKVSILIAFFVALILPVQAQTDEEVVQSIRDDIQAVKAKTRETRNLLRDQERDLRKLTAELEKTRRTIQQNKQKERDARKRGKEFTPKPVVRTYTSIYGTEHTLDPSLAAKGVDTTAEKKEKEKKGNVEKEEKVKDEKKAAEKVKDEKGKGEKEVKDEKEVKKAENVEKKETNSKEPKASKDVKDPKDSKNSKAAPATPNRRVSDKEALRLQKQRNKYYENQLKEKQKAAKEAEKTRKKMEKEQKKDEPPVASARRQRDTKKSTEDSEGEEKEME